MKCHRRRFGQNLRGPPKIHKYSKALETFAHWFTLVPSLHQKYETLEKTEVSLIDPRKRPISKKQVEGSCPPRHFREQLTKYIDPYIQMSQFLAHMCISTCKTTSHSIWYHFVLKKMHFSFY